MIKFLFTGDLHARGTNPRNRTDDYKDAITRKLREVWQLAKQHEVAAVLMAGDTFDLPDVANSVLNHFADVFQEAPCPVYAPAGNHDIPGYNVEAYANTSLRLLARLVPQLHIVNDPSFPVLFGKPGEWSNTDVQVTFAPFSGRMDVDGWGYSPEVSVGTFKIHVAHGMLLDHEPPFDRYTLLRDVKTTADMVLTGHDHTGFGVHRRSDGVIFCNPGALCRLSASQSEITRQVQVALIEIEQAPEDAGVRPHMYGVATLIPLQSAAPGEDVLDRSKIEEHAERVYAMENFAALIQTATGEKVLLNVEQIVEAVAEAEGIEADIVRQALEKIAAEKMRIAGERG